MYSLFTRNLIDQVDNHVDVESSEIGTITAELKLITK
jgi:hypothetical protein